MKEKIVGRRYDFIVELEKNGISNCFRILSMYKKEKRKSAITNLNFVISELIYPVLKIDGELDNIDVELLLSYKQGKKLFLDTVNAFRDETWLDKLESYLDEDRSLGGWNANFSF